MCISYTLTVLFWLKHKLLDASSIVSETTDPPCATVIVLCGKCSTKTDNQHLQLGARQFRDPFGWLSAVACQGYALLPFRQHGDSCRGPVSFQRPGFPGLSHQGAV